MNRFPRYIAEVSSNHSQNLDRIIKFIDKSSEIGCDAVKFQLFEVEKLYDASTIKKMPEIMERKKWELPISFLPHIKERCREKRILFGCTPFHLDAVDELAEYVDFFKIASYELLWLDLIRKCCLQSQPLIISTGMANIDEIISANEVVQSMKKSDVAFLHCESSYPVQANEANLASISYLRNKLGCRIGWSDHSRKTSVILRAALKWNADIFEFHLDLDAKGAEYRSGHCWLPDELSETIQLIEEGITADGVLDKFPGKAEIADRNWRADPTDGLRPLKKIREGQH